MLTSSNQKLITYIEQYFKEFCVISDHREAWLCQSVGYLRDEPVESATFSSDGSLLAVAYGKVDFYELERSRL